MRVNVTDGAELIGGSVLNAFISCKYGKKPDSNPEEKEDVSFEYSPGKTEHF